MYLFNDAICLFAGKSQPRTSVGNHALPGPLEITGTLQTISEKDHESVTALLGAWGELLLHDLASTGNLKSQDCCSDEAAKHGECYGKVGHGQCRDYMRTLPALESDECEFSKTERTFGYIETDGVFSFSLPSANESCFFFFGRFSGLW